MMQLSILGFVFALHILGAHSRAQRLGTDGDQGINFSLGDQGSNAFTSVGPIGDCTCTPFYKCYDEETSSSLITVDDRINIPVNTVISTRQELQQCQEILDICCYDLTPLQENPTSNPAPVQPETPSLPSPVQPETPSLPPPVQPETPRLPTITPQIQEEIIADLPPDCLTDRNTPHLVGASCGVRNRCGVDFAFSGFNEGQAQNGEFPWMVAVLTRNTGFGQDMGATNLYVGGGSLIHPRVVLTAAHKAIKYQNTSLTARVGEWNFASTSEPIPHQDIAVREVITHHRYDKDKKIYNMALLILDQPAILGETVSTICLADNPGVRFDGQQNCIVSGWGKNVFGDTGRYQRILKSVKVNVVDRTLQSDQCQTALQSTHLGSSLELHKGFICAGDKGRDACTGDGGSPLVCPHPTHPGQYVQVGVAAWGIGCGTQGLPGVYWGVTPMMEWINCQLNNLETGSSNICL